MNKRLKTSEGFTLAELLIVVAIISVLVAIAIPVLTSNLEKSREATDIANVRSAYGQVRAAALGGDKANDTVSIDDKGNYFILVPLSQQEEDWQTDSVNVAGVNESDTQHWREVPKPGGTCKVLCAQNGDTIIYWNGGNGYTPATVADNAKQYSKAIDAVLSSIYDGIVADRLENNNNHISWVLIRDGKVQAAYCYTSESDKNGGTNAKLSQQELDALNSSISAKLKNDTGYKLSTNSTARVFFDWNGNVISNDNKSIGGQGAYATIDFMPESGNKKTTVTNSDGTWSA